MGGPPPSDMTRATGAPGTSVAQMRLPSVLLHDHLDGGHRPATLDPVEAISPACVEADASVDPEWT